MSAETIILDATTFTLKSLLLARYKQECVVSEEFNATIETILGHRSVRIYDNKELPPNTLELLVAAAQSASTSSNLQTWSVVAVQDQARKNRLSKLSGNQEAVRGCPLFLVWVADLSRLKTLGVRCGLKHESLSHLESFLVATIDSALAAQTAAVAAESMGLGIVYIGGIRNHPEEVARELGLPDSAFATFGMCIGFPDLDVPTSVKPRLPQELVLHKEQYDPPPLESMTQSYNAVMAEFYKNQGMERELWHLHSLNRVRGPDAMAGRDRLVQALKNLGFELR